MSKPIPAESQAHPRKIIHVDMDAFFAAVEERDNPSLKSLPIAVGGSPEGRGVVATANYVARRFGIRSAMSSKTAIRLCPNIVFIHPRFEVYKEASQKIQAVFRRYSEHVEPLSLDEAFLDVSLDICQLGSATAIAESIKNDIFRETGLTASAGVGPNKLVAKIASDFNKPDGLTVVRPDQVLEFLFPLSVRKIPGIGPKTEGKLASMQIFTIAQLSKHSRSVLVDNFGKFGNWLYEASLGYDDRIVKARTESRSIGAEDTFAIDLNDVSDMQKELTRIVGIVVKRIKKRNLVARTVSVKLTRSDFTKLSRSKTQEVGIGGSDEILEVVIDLLMEHRLYEHPVRLLGVQLSNLYSADLEHPPLTCGLSTAKNMQLKFPFF